MPSPPQDELSGEYSPSDAHAHLSVASQIPARKTSRGRGSTAPPNESFVRATLQATSWGSIRLCFFCVGTISFNALSCVNSESAHVSMLSSMIQRVFSNRTRKCPMHKRQPTVFAQHGAQYVLRHASKRCPNARNRRKQLQRPWGSSPRGHSPNVWGRRALHSMPATASPVQVLAKTPRKVASTVPFILFREARNYVVNKHIYIYMIITRNTCARKRARALSC